MRQKHLLALVLIQFANPRQVSRAGVDASSCRLTLVSLEPTTFDLNVGAICKGMDAADKQGGDGDNAELSHAERNAKTFFGRSAVCSWFVSFFCVNLYC